MNISKNKIIIFTRYNNNSASVRYRFLQYKNILEFNNFEFNLSPLFSDNFFLKKVIHNKLNFFSVFYSYLKRFFKLFFIDKNSLVLIHLELFPYLPYFGEKILSFRKIKTIIDLDDAIFLQYMNSKNFFVKFFLANKFSKIFKLNNIIFSGNEYNKLNAIKLGSKKVHILPTVIPVKKYGKLSYLKKKNDFTIVWIGSPSTSIYLNEISDALYELNNNHDIKLRLIGAGEVSLPGIQYESFRWNENTEIKLISECHLGIMPLTNNDWAKGKCGFKLIQYMACSLPSIASPVGVNKDIIDHNINGYLANNQDQWVTYILNLKKDKLKFKRFSEEAYNKVLKNYSYESWHKYFLSIIIDESKI